MARSTRALFAKQAETTAAPAGQVQIYVDADGSLQLLDDAGTSTPVKTTTLAEITDAGTLASQNANAVALTGGSAALTGALTTTAGGIGYATGAGGAVTQTTNKATTVTLNTLSGEITTASASLAANTTVTFTFNNSMINGTSDQIIATHHSGGTDGSYGITARATGAGTGSISVRNVTSGSLSQAIVIKFSIYRGATS